VRINDLEQRLRESRELGVELELHARSHEGDAFEPRILASTLEIRTLLEAGDLDHHNVIGVEIHGELWAQPVPMEFLVRTDFDLETGKVRITDLISPPRVA